MKTLQELKGLGPKKLQLLHKMKIESSEDLLLYLPYRYHELKKSDLTTLKQDDKIILDGIIENIPYVIHLKKKQDKMNFTLKCDTQLLKITIFNRGFLKPKLIPGTTITVIGKYDLKHHIIIASELRLAPLPKETKYEPIYHTKSGITGSQMQEYIQELLQEPFQLTDFIPNELQDKYHFVKKECAIKELHQPTSLSHLKQARLRFKYEELFLFMLKITSLKEQKKEQTGLQRNIPFEELQKFINQLSFSLTEDQIKTIKEIYHDMSNPIQMNRLVQGDVGSGKTIVSILAIYLNYLSGYQSAFMAPTELLAIQHYQKMKTLLEPYHIKVELLTGKLKAKERRERLVALKQNNIDVIIGTHALISDDVIYANLGLVITDEQHRFGVNQRSRLKGKGNSPDILYLSATPIPRTYALTIYGDLDVSSIKTRPTGRKEIITMVKKESELKEVLTQMYEQLKLHHQIYVVAPLIEESEKSDMENVVALAEKMTKAFGKICTIGIMHGKLSATDKNDIMERFINNDIQILISTTVIEVGVDVKNATMMVIFDAYQFGLSALHQLRGRVGRNNLQSYCILISNREIERLNILTQTNDGFVISEEDFRLRGSGDLFGIRQSGDMEFLIADIKRDFPILQKAKEDSQTFYQQDPHKLSPIWNVLHSMDKLG